MNEITEDSTLLKTDLSVDEKYCAIKKRIISECPSLDSRQHQVVMAVICEILGY